MVGEPHGFANIVRDHQHRGEARGKETGMPVAQADCRCLIERHEGFIENE